MDKLQRYRQIVQEILADQAHPYTHSDEVDTQIICDIKNDHYQLCYIGWEGQQRIFGVVLHFDIKDEKIWIQCLTFHSHQYIALVGSAIAPPTDSATLEAGRFSGDECDRNLCIS